MPAFSRRCARGSSPLTRGKRQTTWSFLPPWRLIPAHAGKTHHRSPQADSHQAHPRSRGENPTMSSVKPARWRLIPAHAGKTMDRHRRHRHPQAHPRSRGENRREDRFSCAGLGLIPAHAGKTCAAESRSMACEAHPRSRGENPFRMSVVETPAGSSPLTRGKPWRPCGRGGRTGLIPAHAGKTDSFYP